jgi:hypothetical protein
MRGLMWANVVMLLLVGYLIGYYWRAPGNATVGRLYQG